MSTAEYTAAAIAEDLELRTWLVLEQAETGELDNELVFQLTRYLGVMMSAFRAALKYDQRRRFETTSKQWDEYLKTIKDVEDAKHPIPEKLVNRVVQYVLGWRQLFLERRLTYVAFETIVEIIEAHLQKMVDKHDKKEMA